MQRDTANALRSETNSSGSGSHEEERSPDVGVDESETSKHRPGLEHSDFVCLFVCLLVEVVDVAGLWMVVPDSSSLLSSPAAYLVKT